MSKQLPPQPNIEILRKEARRLLRSFHGGDPEATRSVKEHIPDLPPSVVSFSLRHAHQIVARLYGFSSWQALRKEILPTVGEGAAYTPPFDQLANDLTDAFLAGDASSYGWLGERLTETAGNATDRAQLLEAARLLLAAESGCGSVDEFVESIRNRQSIVTDPDDLRVFEDFHDVFANHLAGSLGQLGLDEVSVEKAFVDQTTYGEYLMSMADPKADPNAVSQRSNAVLQMSSPVLPGDFALSIPSHVHEGSPSPLTADLWTQHLRQAIAAVWDQMETSAMVIRQCHSDAFGGLRFAPLHEVSLLFAYEVSVRSGEQKAGGIFEACYPRTSLGDMVTRVSAS